MQQRILTLLIVTLYNFFCLGSTCPERSEFMQNAIEIFELHAADYMVKGNVPGLAIAVTYNGSTVYAKGLGYKDRNSDPVMTDTFFRLASNSKMLTAIAIMQMWEKGLIELDELVVNYLPWFKLKDPAERWKKITVRQLLNHTAGISRGEGSNIWDYQALFLTGKLPTSENLRTGAINQEIVADPGSRLKYSNLGYWILSQIIAEYGGSPGETIDEKYINYMKNNILSPLELFDSGYVVDPKDVRKMAKPYGITEIDGNRSLLPLILDPAGLSGGFGGFYSSAKDLSKFLIWLTAAFQGHSEPLLKPGTMKIMISNPISDPNSSNQYGFGFFICEGLRGPVMGHSGSFLGYKSQIKVDLTTGIGIAILTNVSEEDSMKYWNLAFSTIGNALQGLQPVLPTIEQTSSTQKQSVKESFYSNIIGHYEYPFGHFDIYETPEKVLMLDTLTMEFVSQEPGRMDFKMGWEGPFTDIIGDTISFYLNTDDEVKYLIITNTTRCYRISELINLD